MLQHSSIFIVILHRNIIFHYIIYKKALYSYQYYQNNIPFRFATVSACVTQREFYFTSLPPVSYTHLISTANNLLLHCSDKTQLSVPYTNVGHKMVL